MVRLFSIAAASFVGHALYLKLAALLTVVDAALSVAS
jgi:hypothetical protein